MMNSKKNSSLLKYLLLAIFTLSCLLIPVGAVSAEETDGERGYSAFLYDNGSGLLTSEANAIAQTSIGFIWIGGYSGLTRYDGSEFHHFDSSSGISSVNYLYVDSQDRLWIGTNDSGVAMRQNAQFQLWGRNEGLISLSVRAICEDGAGNIIIATTSGLAYINSDGELFKINDPKIEGKYLRRLTADKNGVIYGCTMDSCFFSMENLKLTSFYDGGDLGLGEIYCITPDPVENGKVYLGTDRDRIVVGNMADGMKTTQSIFVSPQEHINDIYFASDGKMWLCANNGLGYFDETGRYVEMKNLPMNSSITTIMEDFEGNLWFTSSRQGVMKIISSPFTDITGIAGLDRVVVNTTCMYQGDLYIGTDAGLQLLDKNYKQKENVLTELLEGVRIRSIKADSAGRLWLCTYSTISDYGLICYYGDGTYKVYNEESGMVSSKIRTLTELSDGTIAVAGSGGVNLIRNDRIVATYDGFCGISNTEILSIAEGENGSIYFGSDGGGLYIIEENEQLRQLGMDDGLKSEIIMQLHKDPLRDVYWIITSNSISYLKNGEIYTLSNFPYSDNYDMQFDANGGIWILSSNGIYFVNGDNLLEDEDLVYSFYDTLCGLPSIATSNSRNYISDDGTLYIAGVSGVSSININTARKGKNDAKLVIPFIMIDDEEVYVKSGESIILRSDCMRITINGLAMTYTHNPQVSYYLEGFDTKATMVSRHEMQPVSYTNLRSGEYTFHMSIIDVMTGEAVNNLDVKIIKEKAFYEQLWFWLIVAVAAALIVILIMRAYARHKMAQLLKKEKEDRVLINQLVKVFAKSIDVKDAYTNGHSFRVAEYTKMIAEKIGYMGTDLDKVYNIGLMHDIGKIVVPNEILNKPGKLTDEEFLIMKQHAIDGYYILQEVDAVPDLALGAGFHHERIDGKGYPYGKKADEIPEIAQMIAVADTFDAMFSTRPYRKKMELEKVIAELKRVAGTQLNERFVQAMLDLIEEGKIKEE
ncbi:MAG: HD domain-containing protein [Oscillospiraceae bacterium]|nr:HD domain-containing protein [Oscillospiraceae bacterium]